MRLRNADLFDLPETRAARLPVSVAIPRMKSW